MNGKTELFGNVHASNSVWSDLDGAQDQKPRNFMWQEMRISRSATVGGWVWISITLGSVTVQA